MMILNCISWLKTSWPSTAVYIAMTFFSFGWMNYGLGHQDLVYTKICYDALKNVTLTECESKRYTHHRFQDEATTWLTWITVLEKVPSLIAIVLLSSYTDKVAHKLPMILASTGYMLALAWLALNAHFLGWSVSMLLIAPVLIGCCGSFAVMFMSCVGYVSLAHPENKAFHISLFYSSFQLGKFIGTVVQGPIGSNGFSREIFFWLSAGAMAIALIIICCVVVDIKKPGHELIGVCDILGGSSLRESVMCAFKAREGRKTRLLQLSLVIFFMMLCSTVFEFSTEYLYFTKELHLSLAEYSHLKIVINSLRIGVPPLAIFICQRILKVPNFTLMLASMACIGGEMILLGQGSVLLLWFSAVVGSPNTIFSSMMQGYQVELIGRAEVGKILSYTAFFQILVDLIGQVASKNIYKVSLDINIPGLVYLLACAVVVLAMMLAVVLDRLNSQEIENQVSSESDVAPIIDPDEVEIDTIENLETAGECSNNCTSTICCKTE